YAADVDHNRRRSQSQFQKWNQAVSAGEQLGARMFAKKVTGFGNRTRTVIIKFRCVHLSPPRVDGLPHPLGCEGHVDCFDTEWAQRIEHGVVNGGSGRDRAGFADAFDTEWMVW